MEATGKKNVVIEPEVWQYHVLGFVRTAMRDYISGGTTDNPHGITVNTVRMSTGATNDKTVRRWQSGEDIYLNMLLRVCDELHLDPLRFISVDGHRFRSTLEDLYRLEMSGTDCATLLQERGIEPASYSMHRPMTTKAWAAEMLEREERLADIERKGIEYERNKRARSVSAMDNISLIEQVARIQREAFEHENHSVAAIRREYQRMLDESQMRVGAAENEVSRLRDELRRANEQLAQLRERRIYGMDDVSGMRAADDK